MVATPATFEKRRLPWSISWAAEKSSSGDSLQYLIDKAAPGGTAGEPSVVLIDVPVDYPTHASGDTGIVVPKEVVLMQEHGAGIKFNQAHSKFTMLGEGVKDIDKLTKPIFIDAPVNHHNDANQHAGGANHKGVKWDDDDGNAPTPQKVSTRAFGYTNADENKSSTLKTNAVDRAFINQFVQINIHPDVIGKANTGEDGTEYQSLPYNRTNCVLRPKRNLMFLNGDHISEYNHDVTHDNPNQISFYAPFLCDSDTHIRQEPGAKIYQPPRANADKIGIFNARYEAGEFTLENFSVNGMHILGGGRAPGNTTGGALSVSGTRQIISSGNCNNFEAMFNILEDVTGYGIAVLGASLNKDVNPENCTVAFNKAYNIWTQFYNCVRGINVRFLFNEIINNTTPLDWDFGSGIVTHFGGALFDIEANHVYDIIVRLLMQGNRVTYPKTLPVGHTFASSPYAVQGIDAGIQQCDFIDNSVFATKFSGFGMVNAAYFNGVDGLRVRNFTLNNSDNFPFVAEFSRDVEVDNGTINGGTLTAKFIGCANVKVRGLSVNGQNAPEIIEEEMHYPIIGSGTNLQMARHFLTGNYVDHPQWYRIHTHYGDDANRDGLHFNLNGQTFQASDVDIEAPFRTLTSSVDYGTLAGKTFTTHSSDTIPIVGHGFYTGQAVEHITTGTFPTVSGVGTSKRSHIVVVDADNVKLAATLGAALAGTTSTITGGSGTQTLRPYKINIGVLLPAAINTSNGEITWNGHNLETGCFIQYDVYGGANATGLWKWLEHDGTMNRNGIYEVLKISANVFKLKATDGANKGNIVIPSTQGTGKQLFVVVAKTAFGEFTPNQYEVDDAISVTLPENSNSRIVRPVVLNQSPIGTLDPMVSGLISETDSPASALMKLQNLILGTLADSTLVMDNLDTPIWDDYALKSLHQTYHGALLYVSNGVDAPVSIGMDAEGVLDVAAATALETAYGETLRIVQWNGQRNGRHLTAAYSHAPLLDIATLSIRFQDSRYFNFPSMLGLNATGASIFTRIKGDSDTPSGTNGGLYDIGTGEHSLVPNGDGIVYEAFGAASRHILVDPTDTFTTFGTYSAYSITNDWSARWKTQTLPPTPITVNTVGFRAAAKLGLSASDTAYYIGNMEWLAILVGKRSADDETAIYAGV